MKTCFFICQRDFSQNFVFQEEQKSDISKIFEKVQQNKRHRANLVKQLKAIKFLKKKNIQIIKVTNSVQFEMELENIL